MTERLGGRVGRRERMRVEQAEGLVKENRIIGEG